MRLEGAKMAEVLSQEEIDSLIEEIETGDIKQESKNRKSNTYMCLYCRNRLVIDARVSKLFFKGKCRGNKYGHVYVLI